LGVTGSFRQCRTGIPGASVFGWTGNGDCTAWPEAGGKLQCLLRGEVGEIPGVPDREAE